MTCGHGQRGGQWRQAPKSARKDRLQRVADRVRKQIQQELTLGGLFARILQETIIAECLSLFGPCHRIHAVQPDGCKSIAARHRRALRGGYDHG